MRCTLGCNRMGSMTNRYGIVTPPAIEVDGFYWTVLVPDIVNSGREEQGSDSV
jgi:hypothetical protein